MPYADSEKKRLYNRAYADKHRDRLLAYYKEYGRQNRQRIREVKARYAKLHIEHRREKLREWRAKNRERSLTINRRSYANHRAKRDAESKAWKDRNHKRAIARGVAYRRERKKTDPAFAILTRLYSIIRQALKMRGVRKVARTMILLGCTAPEFAKHIESQFLSGMTWENRSLWHIDHIRPCASFDLADPAQQKVCFHYTNLRPLWKEENQKKGASFNGVSYRKKGPETWRNQQN